MSTPRTGKTLFAGEERRGDWWELFNDINIRKNEQKNNNVARL